MKNVKPFRVELERGQVFKFVGQSSKVVFKCSSGRAWITSVNDLADHILMAGGEIELPATKAIVIEGLADRLELEISQCA
jgi:hypothetical protein